MANKQKGVLFSNRAAFIPVVPIVNNGNNGRASSVFRGVATRLGDSPKPTANAARTSAAGTPTAGEATVTLTATSAYAKYIAAIVSIGDIGGQSFEVSAEYVDSNGDAQTYTWECTPGVYLFVPTVAEETGRLVTDVFQVGTEDAVARDCVFTVSGLSSYGVARASTVLPGDPLGDRLRSTYNELQRAGL